MTRLALIVSASILLASCGEVSVQGSDNEGGATIPARFKGDATATVVFTNAYQSRCMKAGLEQTGLINACTVIQGNRKTIIVPNPCRRRGDYARLLCHELAHVNGWSAQHER